MSQRCMRDNRYGFANVLEFVNWNCLDEFTFPKLYFITNLICCKVSTY